jgi:hypothetical protein
MLAVGDAGAAWLVAPGQLLSKPSTTMPVIRLIECDAQLKQMKPMTPRREKLKKVAIGIIVRLAGVGLIALGDGHDSLWAKALVVVGVAILITGMAILRYLLFQPLLRKLRTK